MAHGTLSMWSLATLKMPQPLPTESYPLWWSCARQKLARLDSSKSTVAARERVMRHCNCQRTSVQKLTQITSTSRPSEGWSRITNQSYVVMSLRTMWTSNAKSPIQHVFTKRLWRKNKRPSSTKSSKPPLQCKLPRKKPQRPLSDLHANENQLHKQE